MTFSIPSYDLYGNLLAGGNADPVHHETIRDRSSLHDWTIRPHTHKHLAQFFVLETPGVRIRLADTEYAAPSPVALLIPPGVPHGFHFPENIEGDVLSIRIRSLDTDTRGRIEVQATTGALLQTPEDTQKFEDIRVLTAQARRAFASIDADREPLLCALARVLVLYMTSGPSRAITASKIPRQELTRHEKQAQAFCDSIEQNFQEQLTVEDYARALGVSPPHLTRICKKYLGVPPNAMIRQRRLVEAKRLLEFTRHTVADVAPRCGFRDPAFFSRAFRQQTGMTPGAYRARKDT
ncbi:helix-turn-helix domain-containing protein [uncultured Roseobacter sp.]|uniref:helix-turn-helix domain-containing protein n=1 Tax=uncultured Roseobacter sp. TaxID=114847 RepID=UPI0026341E9E|nr:helix-turn-helix domain-containing protein [uncultured Roseobacter sp.]